MHSLKDTKDYLDSITQISREFGLEINLEKSSVIIFNIREKPEHLGNIKARKMVNITYSVIEKSCNKLLIGMIFWKSIVLLICSIINLTEDNIDELQKIDNSVYRTILRAAHYSPTVTLSGEIGAPLMRKSYKGQNKLYKRY